MELFNNPLICTDIKNMVALMLDFEHFFYLDKHYNFDFSKNPDADIWKLIYNKHVSMVKWYELSSYKSLLEMIFPLMESYYKLSPEILKHVINIEYFMFNMACRNGYEVMAAFYIKNMPIDFIQSIMACCDSFMASCDSFQATRFNLNGSNHTIIRSLLKHKLSKNK